MTKDSARAEQKGAPKYRHRKDLYPYFLVLTIFGSLTQLFDPFAATSNEYHSDGQKKPRSAVEHHLDHFVDSKHFETSAEREALIRERPDALRLLKELGDVSVDTIDAETLKQLPTQSQWKGLYGDGMVMLGEESCAQYRKMVKPKDRYVGPAGMFNTGTNLFFQLAKNNLISDTREKFTGVYQVPWGKHRPLFFRGRHLAKMFVKFNYKEALPVVVLRDPLQFLHSLCKHPYSAFFRHDKHCPNLIPDENDRRSFRVLPDVFKVRVKYDLEKKILKEYTSLIHLWNEWYLDYWNNADFPVLYIRMEDLMLYPKEVLTRVAKCMDVKVREPFMLKMETAKSHGSKTDLIHALIQTGNKTRRVSNMTSEDLEYVRSHVEQDLLERFHYTLPDDLVSD